MDFDEKLIQEVRKHSFIYNPALKDYRSKRKKEHAWQEVSRRVYLNVTLCKKRWRGLRDCYMRCKRTTKPGGKLKWKYYQHMSFLDNISTSRRLPWNLLQDEYADKDTEHKSDDQVKEDESKILEYFEDKAAENMEFTAEDYELPKVESPLMLEIEYMDPSFKVKLIEEVRQQPCLYDLHSHDYSNNVLKEKAWVDVAKNLNSSADVCKRVWNSLRATYSKTLERMKLRSGAKRKKRWKYFDKMNFLHDYVGSKRIIGRTIPIDKIENANDYFDIEVPEDRTLNSDDLEIPNGFSHSLDPLDLFTASECSKTSGNKRKDDFLSESSVECQSKQSKRKDSTMLLFESLNRNIKNAKLTAKQRLDMESSIANLVYAKLLSYSN